MPRREREHRRRSRRDRRDRRYSPRQQQVPMTVNVKMDITTYGPHNGVIVQSGFFSGRPSTSHNNLTSTAAESIQDLYRLQYRGTPQLHGKYGSTPLLKPRPQTPLEDYENEPDEPPDEFIQPEKVQLNIFGDNQATSQPSPYPTRSQSRLSSNHPYVQQPTDHVLQDTTTTTTTVEVFRTKYDPNNPHEYIHLPPGPESNDNGQLLRAIGPPYEQWRQQKLETQIDEPGYISYRTPTPTPKAVQWARSASVSPNRGQIYENINPYRNGYGGYGSQLSLNVSEAPVLDSHDQNILRTTRKVNQQQQIRPARAGDRTNGYHRNPRSRSESRQDHLGHYNPPPMLQTAFSSPRSPAPVSDVDLYKTRDAWGNLIREVPLTASDDEIVIDESKMRISPVSESETSIFSELSLRKEPKPPPVPPHRSLSAAPVRRSFTERKFMESYWNEQRRLCGDQNLPQIDHQTTSIYENFPRQDSRLSRHEMKPSPLSRSSSRQSRPLQTQTAESRQTSRAKSQDIATFSQPSPSFRQSRLDMVPRTLPRPAETVRYKQRSLSRESRAVTEPTSLEGGPKTSPRSARQSGQPNYVTNDPELQARAAFKPSTASRSPRQDEPRSPHHDQQTGIPKISSTDRQEAKKIRPMPIGTHTDMSKQLNELPNAPKTSLQPHRLADKPAQNDPDRLEDKRSHPSKTGQSEINKKVDKPRILAAPPSIKTEEAQTTPANATTKPKLLEPAPTSRKIEVELPRTSSITRQAELIEHRFIPQQTKTSPHIYQEEMTGNLSLGRPKQPRPMHRTVSEPIDEFSIPMIPLGPTEQYGMRLLSEQPKLSLDAELETDDVKYLPQSITSSKFLRSKYPPVGSDSPSSSRRIRFSEELTSVSFISSSESGSSSPGSVSDEENAEDAQTKPEIEEKTPEKTEPPVLEIIALRAEPRAKSKTAPEFVEFKEEPKIRKTAISDAHTSDLNISTPTVTLDEHRLRISNFEFEQ